MQYGIRPQRPHVAQLVARQPLQLLAAPATVLVSPPVPLLTAANSETILQVFMLAHWGHGIGALAWLIGRKASNFPPHV